MVIPPDKKYSIFYKKNHPFSVFLHLHFHNFDFFFGQIVEFVNKDVDFFVGLNCGKNWSTCHKQSRSDSVGMRHG